MKLECKRVEGEELSCSLQFPTPFFEITWTETRWVCALKQELSQRRKGTCRRSVGGVTREGLNCLMLNQCLSTLTASK